MRFTCADSSGTVRQRIFFDRAIPIESPASWDDVRRISVRYKKVLILGLFGWSNYSHHTLGDVSKHARRFEANGIGLAAFCLGDESTIEAICPQFLPHWRTMRTEPGMFEVEGKSLRKFRSGPLAACHVLSWLSWDGVGESPVPLETFSVRPIVDPLWDHDLDGWK